MKKKKKEQRFVKKLKRYFWTGVATIFPIFITFYLIFLIFQWSDKIVGQRINLFLAENYDLMIPGIGLIVLLALVFTAGILSSIFIGRWLTRLLESILKKMPFVGKVYPSAKKLSQFLFSDEDKKKKFQKVVLVEFPTKDTWSIGFVTNEKLDDFEVNLNDQYVCVFVPLAPAPFSGFVYWAKRANVKELNISIDQAIKFVLSGGVVSK